VRQGASIGLWVSGFPRGATVDIFVKKKVSDIVDPVTFVQADHNGQFGGIRVTVPDSVSLGTLMIQATERQGSLTAAAAGPVTGADDPRAGTQVGTVVTIPTAGTTATPSAAAIASLTPAANASSTSVATASPTAVLNVASRPTSDPEAKPTDNPRPTPQPTPTPQPEPTEQRPQPTAPPEPRPAEQAQASPGSSHTSPAASSYTVQPGDSLSAIAERVYGSADDWKALHHAIATPSAAIPISSVLELSWTLRQRTDQSTPRRAARSEIGNALVAWVRPRDVSKCCQSVARSVRQ
jgi:LysM repeat protein